MMKTRSEGERNQHARKFLFELFHSAVDAARPDYCVPRYLPSHPPGRTIIIGAGKASAAMAKTVEEHWRGELSGLVVTRYGYGVTTKRIAIIEADHPVPDRAGIHAAASMLKQVAGLTQDDLVICLISGGGSALLPMPIGEITLGEKQSVSRALLNSGASISEINCVRRHLSALKGGRLGVACYPSRLVTLAISDVPGDREIDIASGPTVADPTTCQEALCILKRYRIELPPSVLSVLESGQGESVKPNDHRLSRASFHLVAAPQQSLEAAATYARRQGIEVIILGDSLEGEARELGKAMAAIALQVARHGQPQKPPCVILSGGETTVTVRGDGRGGRNVEFLLSMGIALRGHPGIHAIAGDTDGVDGMEEIAGAYLAPDSLARAEIKNIIPIQSLDNNDAHSFFETLGDSIVTGPTLTNVNDFRAVLVTD